MCFSTLVNSGVLPIQHHPSTVSGEKQSGAEGTRLDSPLPHPLLNLDNLSPSLRTKLSSDFVLYPAFLNEDEQRILLKASLVKLDKRLPRLQRKKAKEYMERLAPGVTLGELFYNDYEFEEGHFDGVIHDFREMRVTSWDTDSPAPPALTSILSRLQSLFANPEPTAIQTHILHLAAEGHILPHVDNVEASGGIILGASLGAERILHMERDGEGSFEILLPSGSVYIQSGPLRYDYKHSILKRGSFGGRELAGGQRLSLMMRDRKDTPITF